MSIKRTIITTILALALVATVAPATTQATTIDDLLAQISALQAQLVALQGGSTPVPTGIVACSGVTFTRDLTVGATGSDVKCLQTLLNANGYTLAATGAGSPGMETSYFGPATLGAVKSFQAAKGWTPANQVGPLTRAALNALIAGTPTTPTTPTTGCPAGAVYNSVTGALCTTVTTTPGATGFLSISSLAASPADNANVTATTNVPVLGLNVKAIGSNMTVSSAKVLLYVTKSSAEEHPATLVRNLYVYDGSTLLGSYPVDTNSVIKDGSNYYVILSGFSFTIPAGTTKVLTISADFAPSLETNRVLEVALLDSTSVRGIDGTGAFSTTGTSTTISSGNPSDNQRTYTVAYATVGTSVLSVTTNSTDLVSTSVNVNHTSGTTDVPMFIFSTKSSTGPSVITDLVLTAQGDDSAVAKLSAVKLYDGSTLLGSQSLSSAVSGATATFSDLTVPVAKDATKTFTVKADFAAAVTDGSTVTLLITNPSGGSTGVTYTYPDLTSTHPTAVAAVSGNPMYLYDGVATTFTLVSATSTYSYNSTTPSLSYTTGKIILKAHSDGGTTTEPVAADFTVLAYVGGTANGAAVSKTITVTPDSTIGDGSDATIEINVSEPRGEATVSGSYSGTGFVDFRITNIAWYVTDGTNTADENTQTWGLSTFKTPAANAQ